MSGAEFPTVGVIGAGQLARMMIAPAIALGVNLKLFAASSEDSAALSADHVVGNFLNPDEVLTFAKTCDVITFEHELIPNSVIKVLEQNQVVVRPSASAFIYSQNKAEMRKILQENNLPIPNWNLYSGDKGPGIPFPLIAKSISGGYDGRGVWVVADESELRELLKIQPTLLLEEKLNFTSEISVMVARSPHGQAATWPPTLTVQRDGICIQTITPAPDLSDILKISAQEIALKIADLIGLVGVMAIELFVVGDRLLINELAARPHNSGHWSIEGSVTSQFEQHLRAILDLPLGDTSMSADFAVMGNVLGGTKTNMYRPYLHLFARTPYLKVHQYRKEVKAGRKVGHVTAIGNNLATLQSEVSHAVDYMNGVIDE
ncbi:MAG: 5-(carboxyamino)imidazole ribonucleotide synthase [Actinobacteria bacterium]|mgnify:FL=1|jgi:5-(carboxyamino)imidazole ribonucleotide synthase|nr:5-(carboxyamino)imidazole ribonucleotide synthase [Actinomycetota bacterium]NDH12292.1 5-(carboxyamino)imidazole ribonucleotide synthase [Actinomycetota bacterium]